MKEQHHSEAGLLTSSASPSAEDHPFVLLLIHSRKLPHLSQDTHNRFLDMVSLKDPRKIGQNLLIPPISVAAIMHQLLEREEREKTSSYCPNVNLHASNDKNVALSSTFEFHSHGLSSVLCEVEDSNLVYSFPSG